MMAYCKIPGRARYFAPDHEHFVKRWADTTTSLMEISIEFGASITTIRNYAQKHRLRRRPATGGLRHGEQYFPTPMEIADACARIRATWGPERFGEAAA